MNLIGLLISFGLLLIAMSVHEFAHGWVAYKLGDNTARYSGRLTLNPLAHIDPVWTLLLPLFLFISTGGRFVFGAAKPVPINYLALKNPKRDIIWIGLAGPLANFAFAFILSLLTNYLPLSLNIYSVITSLIVINVVLGVFNLIPIPPLDGSRIAMGLLPQHLANSYAHVEPYAFIILAILLWVGGLNWIIWPLVAAILRLLRVHPY